MPHIHTEPGQHDRTVSAYIVRYQDGVPFLLLHRHKKYRKLMQPGGHVELDETAWEAIQHEVREETGYDIAQLKLMQPVDSRIKLDAPNTVTGPIPFFQNTHGVEDGTITRHFHDDDVYVFVTDELPHHSIGEKESDEVVWMSQHDIEQWDEADLAFAVKQIALLVLTDCMTTWRPVSPTTFLS